jgi:hypothetical protein
MSMLFKSTRSVPSPKAPPRFGSDTRLSGADQLLARDTDTIGWLAKCYAQQHTASENQNPWPIFSEKKLGAYLAALGVDLDAHCKAVDGELTIPAWADSLPHSIKKLEGCSFLTKAAPDVCLHLRRRRQQAQL